MKNKFILGIFLFVVVVGVVNRISGMRKTAGMAPAPDAYGYWEIAQQIQHPFDSGFREPFMVWWYRIGGRFAGSPGLPYNFLRTPGIFLLPFIFFFVVKLAPNLFSQAKLPKGAVFLISFSACYIYAINKVQIQNDINALRNIWETVFLLWAMHLLFEDGWSLKKSIFLSVAGVFLVWIRISYLNFFILTLPVWFIVKKWPLKHMFLILTVVFVFLFPHLFNNKKISGDFFYTVNYHTANFRNRKFAGKPGFPTKEEVLKNTFAGPYEKMHSFIFKNHLVKKIIYEVFHGTTDLIWGVTTATFFAKENCRLLYIILLPGFIIGTVAMLRFQNGRLLVYSWICYVLPYSFLRHIYWSYRFVSPLALSIQLTAFYGIFCLGLFMNSFEWKALERIYGAKK